MTDGAGRRRLGDAAACDALWPRGLPLHLPVLNNCGGLKKWVDGGKPSTTSVEPRWSVDQLFSLVLHWLQ
jgi:hypothetical protein